MKGKFGRGFVIQQQILPEEEELGCFFWVLMPTPFGIGGGLREFSLSSIFSARFKKRSWVATSKSEMVSEEGE